MSGSKTVGPDWTIPPLESLPAETHWPDPAGQAEGWRPLQQSWASAGPVPGFQPGWARAGWLATHLVYDVVLLGATFRNAARKLNEPTWELGDVCEIFVEATGGPHYVEIHVTPENQRLQLRFPPGAIAAVRRGECRLEQFMVGDPAWVSTAVRRTDGRWHVRVIIPASILGLTEFAPGISLRTAVCRYDYASGASAPLLSSTAPLSAPSFHQRDEWTPVKLAAARPSGAPPAAV